MTWKDTKPSERIIVALDCPAPDAVALGEKLAGHARWVKVGMTLYYAAGPAIVRDFHKLGFKVFVDLKLHDIPHQVAGAAASIAATGADLMTVHASGGAAMLEAAVKGARRGAADAAPLVCGITVLTSMDSEALASVGVPCAAAEQVERLALLAKSSGLDGVVCSPQEARAMRELLGPDASVVTPGVRPAGSAIGDQSRVATPSEAFAAGASHLVIGRPITQASDPLAAFMEIVREVD